MSRPRFRKVYLEITNLCNLRCEFCPGTSRPPKRMTPEEFRLLAGKLRPYTDYLYLHLMGEPLSHPRLEELLAIGAELGFRLMITTNGTLLPLRGELLLKSPGVERISISLHSFEGNDGSGDMNGYLDTCCAFARSAGDAGKKCALRLWNLDGAETLGANRLNEEILTDLHRAFPGEWEQRGRGIRLYTGVYLEYGERFEWPDDALPERGEALFCFGLRDQLGVLVDGTVVPCCLDHDGQLPLGNLFSDSMEEILSSPRAEAIYDGFSRRQAAEHLCRTCGFARRF